MTAPAIINKAELTRMATVAKEQNVAITAEINGRKFTVSPVMPEIHKSSAVDLVEDYGGNSLASWRERRGNKLSGHP